MEHFRKGRMCLYKKEGMNSLPESMRQLREHDPAFSGHSLHARPTPHIAGLAAFAQLVVRSSHV